MGTVVEYLNRQEQEREYEFGDDVDEISLVGSSDGHGYKLLGHKSDKSNEVVNGVFDVLNEEVIDDEVPRKDDGTSVALYHLNN